MKTADNFGRLSDTRDTALYPRLSSADYKNGKLIDESRSITNQKARMTKYCAERGFRIYDGDYDQDDGITGVNFERKGFLALMRDIYAGKIKTVVITDLTRFGRDYKESGKYREIFREHGVRFIAIDDNYDSSNDFNNMNIEIIMKEVFAEYYPAQVSTKVRAVKRMLAEDGKFCNSRAPYGYQKSPLDRHRLVVDLNVKRVVERIFDSYLNGMTARAIADSLNKDGVSSPNKYFYDSINKPNPNDGQNNLWGAAAVKTILKNPAYYGAMSNCKREKRSYKNAKIDLKPVGDWIIVEGTHEAIVTKERWEQAQVIRTRNAASVKKTTSNGEHNIFTGVIKCGNCGGNMTYKLRKNKTRSDVATLRCSNWIQKNNCSSHEISYEVVYAAVLADIREFAVLADKDEAQLIERIRKEDADRGACDLKRYEKDIRDCKGRIGQIDNLIRSLYEDKVSGVLPVERFRQMSQGFETEQAELKRRLEEKEREYARSLQSEQDVAAWLGKIKECLTIDALDRSVILNLIDRIDLTEMPSEDGSKAYNIDVKYKVGARKKKADVASA